MCRFWPRSLRRTEGCRWVTSSLRVSCSGTGVSTYTAGAPAGAGWKPEGNTVSMVVVRQPLKNAGTPALSSRCTVVQSRQPMGPWALR